MRKSNYQIAKEYAETSCKDLLETIVLTIPRYKPIYQEQYDIFFEQKLIELEDRKYTLEEMEECFEKGRMFQKEIGYSDNVSFEEFIKTIN